jgi:uncharacterized tellurite resistance protein B-like protein
LIDYRGYFPKKYGNRFEEEFRMNEKEKVSYLKALMYIAAADDVVEESEEAYLDQLGQMYGLSDVSIAEIKQCILNREESIEEILSNITKREMKLTLLYDLLALCYADNNYSLVEKNGMRRICEIMGLEESKLQEMENLMAEQVELQKKINKALER